MQIKQQTKFNTFSRLKTLKPGERNFLNLIKNIYEKHTANLTMNDEKLKAFLLRSGTRLRCPLSLLPLNTTEVLARTVQPEREVKGVQVGRKKLNHLYSQMT